MGSRTRAARLLIPLCLGSVVVVGPTTAFASPVVQIAEPEIDGKVPAAWPDKVRARLAEAFETGGLEAYTSEGVPVIDTASQRLRADLAIEATGRDFELTLVVVDVATGASVATVADSCDTCGFAELGDSVESVATMAVRAFSKGDPLPATLELISTPPGAEVSVDGESVGTTPVEVSLPAGEHELTVTADGHVPHRRRLVVASGELLALDTALAPTPSAMDEAAAAARRRRLAIGSAALVGGVSGIVAGAALVALHGKPVMRDCAGTDVDGEGDCRFLHDTRGWGGAAIGIGAAAVVAGSVVLGVTLAKHPRRRARASISPSGLAVRGRF